jgi:hypothetical protein
VLSEDLVSLLPRCVANVRGASKGPSRKVIGSYCDRSGLPDPSEQPKEAAVRLVVSEGLSRNPAGLETFVKLFIVGVRAGGGFSPTSSGYIGQDTVELLQQAFAREGWDLTADGELQPRILESLDSQELNEVLQAYVRRARRGIDDPELVIGTSKCLEEAVARHVLAEVAGGYSSNADFISTLYMAFNRLDLATPATTDRLDDDPYQEMIIAIHLLGRAANRLRNDRGDGHGRPAPAVATALEARLTAVSAALVSDLLLASLDAQTGG